MSFSEKVIMNGTTWASILSSVRNQTGKSAALVAGQVPAQIDSIQKTVEYLYIDGTQATLDENDIVVFASSSSGSGTITIIDQLDSHGGTIRHINGVDISDSTIAADKVLSGYVGYTANGTRVVGTASVGTTPSGTKQINISTNGITIEDVTSYASAEIAVNVPTGTARTSADLTVSGATVTVPAGLYSEQATKSVASGAEGTPVATKGTVSNHAVSVTPSVTNIEGYISGGARAGTAVSVSASELVSGTLTVDSSGTKDVTNYASASVPSGTAGTPSATKGTVSNHSVSVTPSVTNITGWIVGSTKTGTAVTVSASELVSGTLNVSKSGTQDVTNYENISVPAGSEGTPSATKGTVNNHSISVTPSVTNSGGYIAGGTKTGTAVNVSASELVSGSETKTANGTYDVTNLANLVVAVPIVTYYTGSSAPSSSLGSNGDIYLQTN